MCADRSFNVSGTPVIKDNVSKFEDNDNYVTTTDNVLLTSPNTPALVTVTDKLMPADSLHIKTSEDDKDLDTQAAKLEDLIKIVAKALAKIINTAFGNTEAVSIASTASN